MPFVQNTNLLYLSGIDQEDSILINKNALEEKMQVIVLDNLITAGKEGSEIPNYETNLVGYWNFNSDSNNSAVLLDNSGNNNDGNNIKDVRYDVIDK